MESFIVYEIEIDEVKARAKAENQLGTCLREWEKCQRQSKRWLVQCELSCIGN